MKKYYFILLSLLSWNLQSHAQSANHIINLGWRELIQDNDTSALKLFNEAYEVAKKENNKQGEADALLHLGISSYGASLVQGLEYATQAMESYSKLKDPQGIIGRNKCIQLISTIKAREGKFDEAIRLSKEAMAVIINYKDSSSYLGIIYASLGKCYHSLQLEDSSNFYTYKALEQRIRMRDTVYLAGSYCKVADIELKKNNKSISEQYYLLAYSIATNSRNRQAKITSLIGLSQWTIQFDAKSQQALLYLLEARQIAESITDKTYFIQVLEKLKSLKSKHGLFLEAFNISEEISKWKDTLANWEKEKLLKTLEVQFKIEEKDKQLKLVEKEKDIIKLTNYMLYGALILMCLLSISIYFFLKRMNKRDKLLLQTKEKLMQLLEDQKKLKEQQLSNEIEFKESQLSALTFQMLQKNELMHEIQEKMSLDHHYQNDSSLTKIINKGLNQDKEWTDFNAHFESINKNFYTRIKQSFPDISPNELKICALIKMNLSTKEMAGILNISPDSVKTARYRLRKKLQLNTEDNLTEFILNLN